MNTKPKGDVGVIIGRFQVPKLHEAHKELIQSVLDRHPKVLIILGLSPLKTTFSNPLDLEMRRHVITDDFPQVAIAYAKDVPHDDELWSRRLDEIIEDNLTPNQNPVLYGGRESFIPFYKGKYPVVELEPKRYVSGSEIRQSITKKVMASPEFRAGVIWATGNQYSVCYPTVDVAILNEVKREVLLARKPNETLYRFVGGFATPFSPSFEQDAAREVLEETGLEVTQPVYIGSFKIDDPCYKREASQIKTLLFVASYVFGTPKANDDIAEVRWISYNELAENEKLFVPEHRVLRFAVRQYLLNKKELCN